MDPRFLQLYNDELQYLREMGGEFAKEFPRVAGRLGMSGIEVADPYVERLLEGVAFLTARIQRKLDAEFPRFTQALLEIVYPHYLTPTPSMLIAQLTPKVDEPSLATGLRSVPRGTIIQGPPAGDDGTSCEFQTAHDVTLWPLEIAGASYFSFAPDLALNTLPIQHRINGGVRIRLRTTGGVTFDQLALDRLCLYLTGLDETANGLFELCLSSCVGVLVGPPKTTLELLPARSVRPVGFDDDQALLPVTERSFQGYRLLQEYFAFPERYRFVEVTGLAPALARAASDEIELVILLGRGNAKLEAVVGPTNFALFCTPAINLFEKHADRIHIEEGAYEYHVVPDRTRPIDFEIYEVTRLIGHGSGSDKEQQFRPFYAAWSDDDTSSSSAYYTTRREPRLLSSSQKRDGTRSAYVGTEVFLSLVDTNQAPFDGDLRQLSVRARCTNRDLPLHMPIQNRSGFSLDVSAPVASIGVVSGPSRPYAPLADGVVSWRALSHLSLNYLSLVNSTSAKGAAALRDLLDLYRPASDESGGKQIDGVRAMAVQPVVRRLPGPGPLTFVRGIEIDVLVNELAFEGGSAFLFGSVLAQYFRRHVSVNSFTETVLRAESRGEINRWVPEWGARPSF